MSLPTYTILSSLRVRQSRGEDDSSDDGYSSDEPSRYGDGPTWAKYREAEEKFGISRPDVMVWALKDLVGRVIDWKGYKLEEFGELLLFDRIPICTSRRPSFRLVCPLGNDAVWILTDVVLRVPLRENGPLLQGKGLWSGGEGLYDPIGFGDSRD